MKNARKYMVIEAVHVREMKNGDTLMIGKSE